MKWPGKTTFMPRHIGLLVFDSLVFYANAAHNGSWSFHDTYKTSYHHESEREKKERHPDVATINRFEFCWSHHRHPHIEGISQCRPQQLVCFRADFFHVTLLRVFSYFLWDYFLWKKRDEWLLWFATALQRLQALIVCRKKLWNGETIAEGSHEFEVLEASRNSAVCEADWGRLQIEAAQSTICNPALCRECSTGTGEHHSNDFFNSFICNSGLVFKTCGRGRYNKHTRQIQDSELFNTLLLSARLFAVTYFVVVYEWFIIGVLIIHINILRIMLAIWPYTEYSCGCCCYCCGVCSCLCDFHSYRELFDWYLIIGLSWIGYDTFDTNGEWNRNRQETLVAALLSDLRSSDLHISL